MSKLKKLKKQALGLHRAASLTAQSLSFCFTTIGVPSKIVFAMKDVSSPYIEIMYGEHIAVRLQAGIQYSKAGQPKTAGFFIGVKPLKNVKDETIIAKHEAIHKNIQGIVKNKGLFDGELVFHVEKETEQ